MTIDPEGYTLHNITNKKRKNAEGKQRYKMIFAHTYQPNLTCSKIMDFKYVSNPINLSVTFYLGKTRQVVNIPHLNSTQLFV